MVESPIAPLRALDLRLERAYRRFGWRRLLLCYVAFGWAAATLMGWLVLLGIARVERAPAGAALGGLVRLLAFAVVATAVALVWTDRVVRPLRLLDTSTPVDDDTWRATLNLPFAIARCGFIVGALVMPVGVVWAYSEIHGNTQAWWTILVLGGPSTAVVGVLTGAFGLQVVLRPVLRDLASRTGAPTHVATAITLRRKLLFAGPAITLVLVMVGVAISAEPGASIGHASFVGLITAALAALIVIPVAIQQAWSVLQPLDDLLDATERLKAGDFETPVPEFSGDEYGILARSFNEAMQGLAERKGLADENAHLLNEVRASRSRIVAASDAERRRIERNIHDGAQQRLVALSLDLRMLEMRASGDDVQEIRAMAEAAGKSLKEALEEIRELARGLHPSVLATDGLRPALEQLASIPPIPVTIDAIDRRFDDRIESTAYFVASEALTNTAKYAQATCARVSVHTDERALIVTIADDGVGGATPHPTSGLAGLADRVAALDGTIAIRSPVGGGTTITATLPL